MKLAVIEPEYHAEVLNNLCLLLQGSSLEVIIVTQDDIYNQLDFNNISKENFTWLVNPTGNSFNSFFKNNFSLIDTADVVLLNTVATYHKLFSNIKFSGKSILRIHNAITHFDPWNSIKLEFTPYFIFKDLSHFLRRVLLAQEIKFRNKLLKSVDYLSLPNRSIEEYCDERGYLEDYKLLPSLPFCYNQFAPNIQTDNQSVKIVIPGTIDNRRKDYLIVYHALKSILKAFNKPVELVLLGRPKGPYGRKVTRMFQRLSTEKLKVKTYTEKVVESEFITQMTEANFLLLPLVTKTRYHFYQEEYGFTKMSGGINDIIRFGKPAIISKYPLSEDLEKVTDQFTNQEELKNLLIDRVNNGFNNKAAEEVFKNYDLINQQKKLIAALSTL